MEQLTKILEHKDYYNALKNILSGVAVLHLDKIRDEYNKKYSENGPINYWYDANVLMFNFALDAENQLLLGKNPLEIYKFVADTNEKIEEYRTRVRKVLEYELERSRKNFEE